MTDNPLILHGTVTQGHGVASGQSGVSPYKGGSLRLQLPYFQNHGISLESFYLGTINVDISPRRFELIDWDHEAIQVQWTDLIPAEDFFFSRCEFQHENQTEDALIYYPSPDTKVENFHNPNIVEILAPEMKNLKYGDSIKLFLNPNHCSVT
jgi:hypothetical protein